MQLLIPGVPRIDPQLSNDQVLWRYMDLPSCLSVFASRAIHFRRGDCFSDKHEGAFTLSVKQKIESSIAKHTLQTSYSEFKEKLRQRVFISCWHASIDDSMAMWALYGKGALSIAVTTTVDQLAAELRKAKIPHPLAIEKVKYIKHWRNPKISISPYSNVFKYKVKAYAFEKEVRVIIDRMDQDWDEVVTEDGMSVQVTPQNLIRSIVVSPDAPEWFHSVVTEVVSKFGLSPDLVRRSKLSFSPL